MSFPLVTFVSPCYNHSEFVIESLESIRKQSYPNIEHIIIDDCSTDDSACKIQNWISQNNYKCQFIRHTENKGISYTLNETIKLAKGEYWSSLATDDFIVPDRTKIFVNYLMSHPGTDMVVSDCRFIDKESKNTFNRGTNSFLKYCTQAREGFSVEKDFGTYISLLEGNYIPSSTMQRTSVFREVGGFNTSLVMEDWDIWLRISGKSRIGYIDEPLTFYRLHDNNTAKLLLPMTKGHIYTFLNQYKYCKKNGYMNEYKKKYERNFFFSPISKFNLTFFFISHSPKHFYILFFLKRLLGKPRSRYFSISILLSILL